MNKNINWTILLRYLNGDASLEEELKVREWVSGNKENLEFIQFLEIIWQMEPNEKKKIDAQESWDRFVKKFDFDKKTSQPQSKKEIVQKLTANIPQVHNHSRKRTLKWGWMLAVAAAILVSVMTSIQFIDRSQNTEAGISSNDIEYRVIRTQKGQRTRVLLSDGSVIYLNSDSYVKIPKTFRQDAAQQVYLEGEAFFEISKRKDITFQVIAAEAVTTVLGTKFNVLSYPEDNNVTVTVVEGEVSLQLLNDTSSEPMIITENQKGVIGREISPFVSKVINLGVYPGWTHGELVFDQEPLPRMIRKLERWYDIEIELETNEEGIKDKKLTATYSQNQSVDDVLQSISLAIDLPIREIDAFSNKYKFFSKP